MRHPENAEKLRQLKALYRKHANEHS